MNEHIELVLIGRVGDTHSDAVFSAVSVTNSGAPPDLPIGEVLETPLSAALGKFSADVIFGDFRDQLINLFFGQDGSFETTQVFLITYREVEYEPDVRIMSMSPINNCDMELMAHTFSDWIELDEGSTTWQ